MYVVSSTFTVPMTYTFFGNGMYAGPLTLRRHIPSPLPFTKFGRHGWFDSIPDKASANIALRATSSFHPGQARKDFRDRQQRLAGMPMSEGRSMRPHPYRLWALE